MKARKKSFIRTVQSSLKQVDGAREQFLIDDSGTVTHVDRIEEIEVELVPDYIKVLPICPGGGKFSADATNIHVKITILMMELNLRHMIL